MKINEIVVFIFILFIPTQAFCQGKNHNWLIGYDVGLFDTRNGSDTVLICI